MVPISVEGRGVVGIIDVDCEVVEGFDGVDLVVSLRFLFEI